MTAETLTPNHPIGRVSVMQPTKPRGKALANSSLTPHLPNPPPQPSESQFPNPKRTELKPAHNLTHQPRYPHSISPKPNAPSPTKKAHETAPPYARTPETQGPALPPPHPHPHPSQPPYFSKTKERSTTSAAVTARTSACDPQPASHRRQSKERGGEGERGGKGAHDETTRLPAQDQRNPSTTTASNTRVLSPPKKS